MEEKKKMVKVTEADALLKLQELKDRRNSLMLEDNKVAPLQMELLLVLERATLKKLQRAKDQLDSIEKDKRAMKEALLSAKKFDSYQKWEAVAEQLVSEFLL